MKWILYFSITLSFSSPIKSQQVFTSFFAGMSNYSGDLSGSNYFFRHSHPAWGLGFMVELNDRMFIRADFTDGKISGDDKFNPKNRSRNLSFQSTLSEYSLSFEYVLFDLYDYKVSPYVFAGVAAFQFKPTTKDSKGNYIVLPDYATEGQGFYEDRKPYKLRQFSIPMGGGVLWALTDNKRIGFVVGVRKTFTDYLDDVSTTYINRSVLAQNRGLGAVAMAYRGDGGYPAEGTERGNPKNNDLYFFSGLTFRVRLAAKGKLKPYQFKPFKSKYSCPRNIW